MKIFNSNRAKQGFTLVEVLVAIAIFSVVTTIAVGGFVSALKAHRQSLAIMAANSNISSALEQMAREIRTGRGFSGGGNSIVFNNSSGNEVIYSLVDNSVVRTFLGGAEKITDNNVLVDYLRFIIFPLDVQTYPPRISINIGIRPKVLGANTGVINFQTTISSRNF